MSFRRILFLLLVLPAAAPGQSLPVSDDEYFFLGFPVTLSDFSGGSGGTTEIIRANSLAAQGFLKGLDLRERGNRPCALTVSYRGTFDPPETFNTCNGSTGSDGQGDATMYDGAYVTGIEVCHNRNGTRIKGYRLYGHYPACLQGATETAVRDRSVQLGVATGGLRPGEPRPSGSFDVFSCAGELFVEAERPRCNRWMDRVNCADGQVAYGVRANIQTDASGRGALRGLGLVCAPLRSRSP